MMQHETVLPKEYATDPQKRTEVLHIVSNLPINQRLALVAHFYGGLSVQETATAMKSPVWVTTGYLDNACENVLKELGMSDMSMNTSGESSSVSMLTDIFNWYEAEFVTDDRTQKVLEPILKMIREKKFDRPRWHRYSWLVKPALAIATIVTLAITVAVSQTGMVQGNSIVVPDADVPMAAMSMDDYKLSGMVSLKDKGVGGLEITLVDTESGETVQTAITSVDGAFSLSGISGGTYKLRVLLPKGMALVEGDTEGNVRINQNTDLVIGRYTKNEMESVDIQVWLTD